MSVSSFGNVPFVESSGNLSIDNGTYIGRGISVDPVSTGSSVTWRTYNWQSGGPSAYIDAFLYILEGQITFEFTEGTNRVEFTDLMLSFPSNFTFTVTTTSGGPYTVNTTSVFSTTEGINFPAIIASTSSTPGISSDAWTADFSTVELSSTVTTNNPNIEADIPEGTTHLRIGSGIYPISSCSFDSNILTVAETDEVASDSSIYAVTPASLVFKSAETINNDVFDFVITPDKNGLSHNAPIPLSLDPFSNNPNDYIKIDIKQDLINSGVRFIDSNTALIPQASGSGYYVANFLGSQQVPGNAEENGFRDVIFFKTASDYLSDYNAFWSSPGLRSLSLTDSQYKGTSVPGVGSLNLNIDSYGIGNVVTGSKTTLIGGNRYGDNISINDSIIMGLNHTPSLNAKTAELIPTNSSVAVSQPIKTISKNGDISRYTTSGTSIYLGSIRVTPQNAYPSTISVKVKTTLDTSGGVSIYIEKAFVLKKYNNTSIPTITTNTATNLSSDGAVTANISGSWTSNGTAGTLLISASVSQGLISNQVSEIEVSNTYYI